MNLMIFTDTFFEISETFIYNQLIHNGESKVILCGFNKKNENIFKHNAPLYLIPKVPEGIIDRLFSKILRISNPIRLPYLSEKKLKKILIGNKIDFVQINFGINGVRIANLLIKLNIPFNVIFLGYDASTLLNDKQYSSRLPALFKNARSVVVLSPFMVNDLKAYELPESKTHIIPMGVDTNIFIKKDVTNSKVVIIQVGRFTPKKGVPDLIDAFNKLPEKIKKSCVFKIVGDGEEHDEVAAKIADAPPGIFQLFGFLEHAESLKEMQTADIFVLNSRTAPNGDKEGVPVSLLEAMSCSLACISTYHAGIPWVIANGENGLLVNEYDNDALSKALEELILNSEKRKKLGAEARKTIEERFSLENTSLQLQILRSR